jgi:hypothetical protein
MLHKLKVIKKDYLIIYIYTFGEFVEECFHKVHCPRNFFQDLPKNVMYENDDDG